MKYPEDFINKIICGDSLSILKTFPAKSIDMCMTSPPYWGLRDYGVEQMFGGDPDCKHPYWATHGGQYFTCGKCGAFKGQLGLEPTPELYIEHLTEIFSEVKRVLKKEGTLWLNIGDTYGGSCQGGGDTGLSKERYRKELLTYVDKPQKKMMPKCLMMIPERLAWSLIQNGWILRNKIIWYKPNAMPSSVTDRFSNRYEFIYMFSKQQKYYFNLNAVREPHVTDAINKLRDKSTEPYNQSYPGGHFSEGARAEGYELGKNPGDVFEINTQPFPEAHFAVFPEKLCEKPIKAGCPEEVCKKCGKARERIVEKESQPSERAKEGPVVDAFQGNAPRGFAGEEMGYYFGKTIGWTSCKCNVGFDGGILLDPFCGAGTALLVAKEMKRNFIGIEINPEYCKIAEERLAQGVL